MRNTKRILSVVITALFLIHSVSLAACPSADLTGDCRVDVADFAVMAENWMTEIALVGHWDLNETSGSIAADSSAYRRDGKLLNMDDSDWVAGKIGNCLEFDGVDDYVEITGYSGISGGRSRTCTAWIKTGTAPGEIVSWGNTDLTAKWIVRLDDSGALRAEVQGGYIIGTTILTDNIWHHVAVVLSNDGSPDVSEIKLYVDGEEEIISTWAACSVNTSGDNEVRIGVFSVSLRFFDGLMDDVRIYDRPLSSDKIAEFAK